MKIRIVAVGKLKEKYLREGVAEYEKRLAPFASVELRETREEYMAENPSEAQRQQTLAKEGERLLRLVPEKSFLIACKRACLARASRAERPHVPHRRRVRSVASGARSRRSQNFIFADDLHASDGAALALRADLSRVQDQPRREVSLVIRGSA